MYSGVVDNLSCDLAALGWATLAVGNPLKFAFYFNKTKLATKARAQTHIHTCMHACMHAFQNDLLLLPKAILPSLKESNQ